MSVASIGPGVILRLCVCVCCIFISCTRVQCVRLGVGIKVKGTGLSSLDLRRGTLRKLLLPKVLVMHVLGEVLEVLHMGSEGWGGGGGEGGGEGGRRGVKERGRRD